MRSHYFFMKFMRSFLIGFGCAMASLVVIAAVLAILYGIYFV